MYAFHLVCPGRNTNLSQEYIARLKETHSRTVETLSKDIQKYRKNSNSHAVMVKSITDKYNHTQTVLNKTTFDLDRERERSVVMEQDLEQERERSAIREQEAFQSRTQLSALQEELAAAIENIKSAEQERDAFKAAAKSEEVARIAAEGRIPLPKAKQDDEFGSPKKSSAPLPKPEVVSSEASEEEIEQLKEDLRLARYHVDTAYGLIDYMNLECHFKCCPCTAGLKSDVSFTSQPRVAHIKPAKTTTVPSPTSDVNMMEDIEMGGVEENHDAMDVDTNLASPLRASTIFVPAEGIFRTVPSRNQQPQASQPPKSYRTSGEQMPPPSFINTREPNNRDSASSRPSRQSPIHSIFPSRQARTPSVEPPTFANNVMLSTEASILSFASAPLSAAPSPVTTSQTVPQYQRQQQSRREEDEVRKENRRDQDQSQQNVTLQHTLHHQPQSNPVHPADMAKGRYRAQDKSVGDQPDEGRETSQSYIHGREKQPLNTIFNHHLHSQNDAVRLEDVQNTNPVFLHNIHSQNELVRRDGVPRERERERRPMAAPAKHSHEVERPREREHHQTNHRSENQHHHRHQRPEHNFRTISTTTRIQIKSEDDDEAPKSASAIPSASHHAFGMPRCDSTLSEPATTKVSDLPVSREEALAMIRERRGRARSMHQDAPKEGGPSRPPTRQEAPKTPRREISVGVVKSTSQRNARSVSRGRLHGL